MFPERLDFYDGAPNIRLEISLGARIVYAEHFRTRHSLSIVDYFSHFTRTQSPSNVKCLTFGIKRATAKIPVKFRFKRYTHLRFNEGFCSRSSPLNTEQARSKYVLPNLFLTSPFSHLIFLFSLSFYLSIFL